jgi:serine phosphatase RsbU (regulator of sigma subunit)
MLVQRIVVNNLQLVNASLDRITHGNLNEVVSVRNSSEFASLSDNINQTVNVLKGYIAAAEKRIEQELEFARTIQESALPKNFAFPRDDFEIYATMDPAKEVGGDFYDFFFVDQNRLALVIADVSGKGIPAALFMMMSKIIVQSYANTGISPAEILSNANETLSDNNPIEMFVTVWLGILEISTGKLTAANAGHEYPYIMKNGQFSMLKDKHGFVIGGMKGVRYKEYEVQLEPGDRIFVYTDGVPEATNAQNAMFQNDNLLKALNKDPEASPEQILANVNEAVNDFVKDAEQFDDLTMLCLEYKGKH